jgi:AraC-like DNA-binding protein
MGKSRRYSQSADAPVSRDYSDDGGEIMLIRECAEIGAEEKRKTQVGGGIHPYYEILHISSGEMTLQWLGNTYPVSSPSLFLLTPNTPHRLVQHSAHYRGWFVEFDLRGSGRFPRFETILRWNGLQGGLNWENKTIRPIAHAIESMTMLLQSGLAQRSSEVFKQAVCHDVQKLTLLIDDYIEHLQEPAKETDKTGAAVEKMSTERQIYELIRFIEGSYTSDISLDMLAERSKLTPSYIIRLFKNAMGMTPIQYLHQLRMNAALSYLGTTGMSIQAVAEACGYPSIHYFSRLFKQTFGISPSEWKKTNLKDK